MEKPNSFKALDITPNANIDDIKRLIYEVTDYVEKSPEFK
jgi:hypothetical protein